MKIAVIPGRALGADLVREWIDLQDGNSDLASPCFHPEFRRSIAAVRPDVEVAVLECEGRPAALFPFERASSGIGRPVGSIISDYHGLVSPPAFSFLPLELLQQVGLRSWDF